jgi:hypothetical protein
MTDRPRVLRAAARPLTRLGVEFVRLFGPLYAVLRERRWSSLSLAGVGSALTVACALAQQALHGPAWLTDLTAERASLPLPTALVRLPGSLFAPALDLPLWGAVAQLAIVAALVQALCGPACALGVGFGAHFATTLAARATFALGPLLPLAVPAATRLALDTGPSVAVLALVAYACARLRCWVLLGLVLSEPIVEVVIQPATLAVYEHSAAVAIGVLAALPILLRRAAGRVSRPSEAAAGRTQVR